MPEKLARLVTRPERIEGERAEQLRELVSSFPGLPDLVRREIVATIDRRTEARNAWTFLMLSPAQHAHVVREIRAGSSRKLLALSLWAELFTLLDRRTGEITATREQLAERIGATANDVTRIMAELAKIGAITRRRVSGSGVRGLGRAVYVMNPNVATNLTGPARDEAQAGAPQLTSLKGGRQD